MRSVDHSSKNGKQSYITRPPQLAASFISMWNAIQKPGCLTSINDVRSGASILIITIAEQSKEE